jgi:hypothetical protein
MEAPLPHLSLPSGVAPRQNTIGVKNQASIPSCRSFETEGLCAERGAGNGDWRDSAVIAGSRKAADEPCLPVFLGFMAESEPVCCGLGRIWEEPGGFHRHNFAYNQDAEKADAVG